MCNKTLLLTVVIGLMTLSRARAEEGKLGVTFDLTYTSKWLSKGVEGYGQNGGLFKTIDVDWYGTGFGVKVTHRNATSKGYADKQRFDYRPYYKSRLFEDTTWATNYNLSVGYEHYSCVDKDKANTTYEWIFAFSWPNLLSNGLVPSYIGHYEYPAKGGNANRDITGWVHRFGLSYSLLKIPPFAEPLRLSWELAYTDGLCRAAHDWSYATFGISTVLKASDNLSIVPGVYQQLSMDDSVNTKDVTYTMFSLKYVF